MYEPVDAVVCLLTCLSCVGVVAYGFVDTESPLAAAGAFASMNTHTHIYIYIHIYGPAFQPPSAPRHGHGSAIVLSPSPPVVWWGCALRPGAGGGVVYV